MVKEEFPTRRDLLLGAGGMAASPILEIGGRGEAGSGISPSDGVLRVQVDTVIEGDVLARPGARVEIAPGRTLALRGDLLAPASRLFTGAGRVDLSRSRVEAARPEWWGAVPDDPAVDCGPALAACLRAHPATRLGLGDYHLARTLVVDRPNRRIWGVGRTNGERGTRLLVAGADQPVVLVGSERAPPSINEYLRGVDMRWIELGRTLPAAAPTGDPGDAPAGLRVRHVLDCLFEGLRANEHAVAYSLQGAVRTTLRDCAAFRSAPSGAGGRDAFIGFDLDGRASPIDTGGNASLFLLDCVARTGGRPALGTSIGCRVTGPFSDAFLVRFETTEVATGIAVSGARGRLTAAQRRAGNIDLHIDTPVLDQCADRGLAFSDLAEGAMVDVSNPYVALGPTGAGAIGVERSGGAVGVSGGQLVGFVAGGRAVGIELADASGVAFAGTKLSGFARPVRASGASGGELVLAVVGLAGAGAHAAVELTRCEDMYLRVRVLGSPGAYRTGVQVDEASRGVTVEAAGLPPRLFASGAAVRRGSTRLDAPDRPAVAVVGASQR